MLVFCERMRESACDCLSHPVVISCVAWLVVCLPNVRLIDETVVWINHGLKGILMNISTCLGTSFHKRGLKTSELIKVSF